MIKKPIYNFDSTSSTGLDKVPLNGTILIEDSGSGLPRLIVLTDKTAIDSGTTISTLLGTSKFKDIDIDTTYESSDFTHDDLTGVTANEHIDWTADDASVIHSANYTNTTYDNSDFVDLTSAQSVAGIKTFTSAPVLPSSTIIEISTDTTPQLGGDLDCNDKVFLESSYNQIADITVTGTTHAFDFSDGDMQELTVGNDITLSFSGFISGKVCTMIVDVVNAGAYTFTYPSGLLFAKGTEPTFTEAGTDRIMFIKDKDNVYSLFVTGLDIGTV